MATKRKPTPVTFTRNTLDGLRLSTFDISDRAKRLIDTARTNGVENVNPQEVARMRFDLQMALKTIEAISTKVAEAA